MQETNKKKQTFMFIILYLFCIHPLGHNGFTLASRNSYAHIVDRNTACQHSELDDGITTLNKAGETYKHIKEPRERKIKRAQASVHSEI